MQRENTEASSRSESVRRMGSPCKPDARFFIEYQVTASITAISTTSRTTHMLALVH